MNASTLIPKYIVITLMFLSLFEIFIKEIYVRSFLHQLLVIVNQYQYIFNRIKRVYRKCALIVIN